MSKNTFFIKRFGINNKLNLLLLDYLGHNKSLISLNTFYTSYHEEDINYFFEERKHFMGEVLRKSIRNNINNKIKSNSYQGFCFKNKLPVRGQRRRSNAKSVSRSIFYS